MTAHGALLTQREVARELGVSVATVCRLEAAALAAMREAMLDPPAVAATLDPLEQVRRRLAFRGYLARLLRCRPGDWPEDEPPPSV